MHNPVLLLAALIALESSFLSNATRLLLQKLSGKKPERLPYIHQPDVTASSKVIITTLDRTTTEEKPQGPAGATALQPTAQLDSNSSSADDEVTRETNEISPVTPLTPSPPLKQPEVMTNSEKLSNEISEDTRTQESLHGNPAGTNGSEMNDSDDYDVSDTIVITFAPLTPKPTTVTPNPEEQETTPYAPYAPRLPKVCVEEVDAGVCEDGKVVQREFKFYYDHKINSCEPFDYSGCNGNGNNFDDEDECWAKCGFGEVYDPEEDARLPKVCKQEVDYGHCDSERDPELRYFYNQYREQCELFSYKGCGGNENNFKTVQQCEDRCIYTPDGACDLKPAKGPCGMNFTRFHWDKELGDCRSFEYSGCGGNDNNFPDLKKCREYCGAKSTYLRLWRMIWSAMQSWIQRGYTLG